MQELVQLSVAEDVVLDQNGTRVRDALLELALQGREVEVVALRPVRHRTRFHVRVPVQLH